jgi:hypothetical protein
MHMHASFRETFTPQYDVVNAGQAGQFETEIRAPSASISGNASVGGDLGVNEKLCVGSVCVDTVAFGQMLRTSTQVNSMAIQSLATAVFMVNSMMGNMSLLPNQSVISLTYSGGDYAGLTALDPTGTPAADFATYVASAVQSAIGSSPDFTSSASATAAFLRSIETHPVPSSIVGHYGITGMRGVDVTNSVASHLALFSTWSSIMPSSTAPSPSPTTTTSSSSSNSATTVYAVSIMEGSIVINLLVTYPSWFTATSPDSSSSSSSSSSSFYSTSSSSFYPTSSSSSSFQN